MRNQKESRTQRACTAFRRAAFHYRVRANASMLGAFLCGTKNQRARQFTGFVARGVERRLPDEQLYHPLGRGGVIAWIEYKALTGVARAAQVREQEALRALGHRVYMVHTLAEYQAALKDHFGVDTYYSLMQPVSQPEASQPEVSQPEVSQLPAANVVQRSSTTPSSSAPPPAPAVSTGTFDRPAPLPVARAARDPARAPPSTAPPPSRRR